MIVAIAVFASFSVGLVEAIWDIHKTKPDGTPAHPRAKPLLVVCLLVALVVGLWGAKEQDDSAAQAKEQLKDTKKSYETLENHMAMMLAPVQGGLQRFQQFADGDDALIDRIAEKVARIKANDPPTIPNPVPTATVPAAPIAAPTATPPAVAVAAPSTTAQQLPQFTPPPIAMASPRVPTPTPTTPPFLFAPPSPQLKRSSLVQYRFPPNSRPYKKSEVELYVPFPQLSAPFEITCGYGCHWQEIGDKLWEVRTDDPAGVSNTEAYGVGVAMKGKTAFLYFNGRKDNTDFALPAGIPVTTVMVTQFPTHPIRK